MRDAFTEHGNQRTSSIPRSRIYLRSDCGEEDFWLNVKAGALSATNFGAIRVDSGLTKSLQGGRVDVSRKSALVFLYSLSTGELLAIFHNDYLQKLRVGAITGVATDVMANKNIKSIAIFGSGRQARTNLEAVCLVRKPTVIRAFSPNRTHLERFCIEMSNLLGIEIISCNSPEEATRDSDIVTVATNSKTPVCKSKDLCVNAHVNSILSSDRLIQGKDIDDETYNRARIIAVNSKAQIDLDQQHPLKEILKSKDRGKIVELSELLTGKVKGRCSESDFTLYDNNVGMGIQFAAICGYVYQKAMETNLGIKWPQDLFDLNIYRSGQADIGNNYESFKIDTYKSKFPAESMPS